MSMLASHGRARRVGWGCAIALLGSTAVVAQERPNEADLFGAPSAETPAQPAAPTPPAAATINAASPAPVASDARDAVLGASAPPLPVPVPPQTWETGFKDTVIAYPGQVTRARVQFNTPGQFVWHCHIVEHEDNEMMRPYRIGPVQPGQPE